MFKNDILCLINIIINNKNNYISIKLINQCQTSTYYNL